MIASATARGRGRRPVNPPLERASTMLSDDPATMQDPDLGPVYGIDDLSAAQQLSVLIAEMEGAERVFLTPSGLAAVTVALTAVLKPGDEVLATDALYGPTRRFLTRHLARWGVTTRFHDPATTTDVIVGQISDRTKVLLMESPSSLTMELVDVPALTKAAKDRGVLTITDNTWAAGLAFRPLSHGVDISVQALTKYVSGHSDVLMGSIAARDPEMARLIAETIEDQGWRTAPDEAWLALRGLRTLNLRYKAQSQSALRVAEWLSARPEVAEVRYPPLPSSQGYDLWRRDFNGAASLMGVVMRGGSRSAAHALMRRLSLFGIGYSWGGFESLVTHETGQLSYRQQRPDLPGELLRLHIGLEDPDDLIADLEGGLNAWNAAL